MIISCSHCGSAKTKQNGHTHYGKQNHFCHGCQRQFVAGGQQWFVSDADKSLINKLLLERISLAGICRVCDVSQTWLLAYVRELYAQLPPDLGATPCLPDVEAYLADRFDEEISRLGVLKKIQLHIMGMSM